MSSNGPAPWTYDDIPDQSGRTFVVTGANAGLGKSTTHSLARRGAKVIMACRSEERAEAARKDFSPEIRERTEFRPLDLADLASVSAFAAGLGDDAVDVLINNAGIMNTPYAETAQGHEMQFGVNVLGHFALSQALEKRLTDRVVWLGSHAHWVARLDVDDLDSRRRKYRPMRAYAESKFACIVLAFEQQRRFIRAADTRRAVAAHPGYTATDLMGKGVSPTFNRIAALGNKITAVSQTPDLGALCQLHAATVPDLAGGSYIGPTKYVQFRGHPRPVFAKARTHDRALGAALWEKLEQMVAAG